MLTDDQGKRAARIERLLQVSRHMGTALELEELLQAVVDAASDLTDSEASSVLLFEEETKTLRFIAGPRQQKEILKRIRVPIEKSLAGRVYTQLRPAVLFDAQALPQMYQEVEKALNTKIFSILAVPMVFRGETIGVLEAVNKRNKTHYSGDDVTILETLATQASLATLSTLMLDETKRAYQELEELEKMKSEFIAIASHELRTPLGLILGHATFLRDSLKDASQRDETEVILRSANRLKKIVDDMSNINSFQSGKVQVKQKVVKFDRLVQEIVASFRDQAKSKRITIESKMPQKALEVEGDEEKLGLAISNLIENALTFTDPGGHVLIPVELLPGYIRMSVIDDGIGIPTKDQPHVFERFYQVESHLTRKHGGMGLGLTVAKAIIEMHNGQIWVESVERKGSSFSILLPTRCEPGQKPAVFEPDE